MLPLTQLSVRDPQGTLSPSVAASVAGAHGWMFLPATSFTTFVLPCCGIFQMLE